eukprot:2806445-Amphidinium_carterae.1
MLFGPEEVGQLWFPVRPSPAPSRDAAVVAYPPSRCWKVVVSRSEVLVGVLAAAAEVSRVTPHCPSNQL